MDASRDYLGQRLRALRKQRGVTGQELAKMIGYSQSGISKVEKGLLRPTIEVVEQICKALKVPAAEKRLLIEQTRLFLEEFNKWSIRSFDSYAESQKIVQEREQRATLHRGYNIQLVFGLLQAPEYMRCVFRALAPTSATDIEEAIAHRIKRQKILHQSGRSFHYILDERALESNLCDRRVMQEQLAMLRAASMNSNLELRILPMGAPLSVCSMTNFAIFDNSLVTVETLTHELTIWTDPDVQRYIHTFSVIRDGALTVEESRKRLSRSRISER